MGGKTVDPSQYIKKRDPSSDFAILMAMQQMQGQQQAQQAALAQAAAQMPPIQQQYDPSAISKRAAELGMANIQKAGELEKLTSPEAAAMRGQQAAELASLASPEHAAQYMNEWAKRQGLMQGYETGLGDSSIGQAARYDEALKAKRAYDEQNLTLQEQILAQMQAPSGGLDPASSIAAKQAAQAGNLQAMQNWQNAMFGNIGGVSQSAADAAAQGMSQFQNLQQAAAQNQQNYMQAMLKGQAANQAQQNAMKGAYINAAGQAIGGIAGAYGKVGGLGAGGTNPVGEYQFSIGTVPRAIAV